MTRPAQSAASPPTPPDEPPSRLASPSTSTTTAQPSSSSTSTSYPVDSNPAGSTGVVSRNEVGSVGEQGRGNEVERHQSLSRVIQERWLNETPEVRERYRRGEEEEKEEARRRAAREQRERG
ncbi:hypothetical protein JCM3765_001209 [Sporobolomyces pararoseus]